MKINLVILCLCLSTSIFAAADDEDLQEGYETPTDTYEKPLCPPPLKRSRSIASHEDLTRVRSNLEELEYHPLNRPPQESAEFLERRDRNLRMDIERENRLMGFDTPETTPDSLWLPEVINPAYIIGTYLANLRNRKHLKRKIMRSMYGCRSEAGFFVNRFDRSGV